VPAHQLHPVQRALARQDAEDRIESQLFVIVDIFIAQLQAINPLREHLNNSVLDHVLISAVEKTLNQPRQQIQPLVCVAQPETPHHRN
jgi:hypothetical protein